MWIAKQRVVLMKFFAEGLFDTFTAVPDDGYVFSEWVEHCNDKGNQPCSISVPEQFSGLESDINISARFERAKVVGLVFDVNIRMADYEFSSWPNSPYPVTPYTDEVSVSFNINNFTSRVENSNEWRASETAFSPFSDDFSYYPHSHFDLKNEATIGISSDGKVTSFNLIQNTQKSGDRFSYRHWIRINKTSFDAGVTLDEPRKILDIVDYLINQKVEFVYFESAGIDNRPGGPYPENMGGNVSGTAILRRLEYARVVSRADNWLSPFPAPQLKFEQYNYGASSYASK